MESAKANRKDTHQEYTNKHTDYSQVERQKRKKEEAELELSKIELEEKGEDFERKRAWDWTIEESENWDKKQQEKSERVKTSKFSDYTTAAERAYLKDLQDLQPDIKDYNEKKIESLKSKGMIIEGKDGEIIAYDMDGSLTTSQDSLSQFSHKPSKKVVDNLVNHLKKGDEQRMKRRKKNDDDEMVSYINEKNKQFNQKLSRHYDKYTKDIRDAFERGTAL
ncbi:uncharacterized protein SAPINGB_P000224 [Magnusiomyces paraingens]|uniref:Pre-mRNA-splicing factor SYF2 n=1 Tax=Magnusiomyces paraingens TaxID=2606893 RepID=A0A5E8AZ13_9ASCO|nr:uncharacterized protein SAPINGB_P000224 [Saprochaete ingens]VVT43944.1 unnamed protein product [Saprochaete ingens]